MWLGCGCFSGAARRAALGTLHAASAGRSGPATVQAESAATSTSSASSLAASPEHVHPFTTMTPLGTHDGFGRGRVRPLHSN